MQGPDSHHDLPWDHDGNCTAEDAERDDLPLYHEAAVEAWVLEHEPVGGFDPTGFAMPVFATQRQGERRLP